MLQMILSKMLYSSYDDQIKDYNCINEEDLLWKITNSWISMQPMIRLYLNVKGINTLIKMTSYGRWHQNIVKSIVKPDIKFPREISWEIPEENVVLPSLLISCNPTLYE